MGLGGGRRPLVFPYLYLELGRLTCVSGLPSARDSGSGRSGSGSRRSGRGRGAWPWALWLAPFRVAPENRFTSCSCGVRPGTLGAPKPMPKPVVAVVVLKPKPPKPPKLFCSCLSPSIASMRASTVFGRGNMLNWEVKELLAAFSSSSRGSLGSLGLR